MGWKHNKFTINTCIYPFPCRLKLGKSLQTCCCNFFFTRWHFKNEWFKRKTIITTITTIITYARLRVQDFATCNNFSFNQCHNKEFCALSLGSYSQIHCIALRILQTSKEILISSVPSIILADLFGNKFLLVIGAFWSTLFVSVFQGSLLVIELSRAVIYKDRIPEPKIQVNHLTRCAT